MHTLVPAWAFDAVVNSFDDPASTASNANGMWCVEARGFPCHALWCAYASPLGAGKPTVHGGLLAPNTFRRPRPRAMSAAVVLPLRPIWKGLLVDSAIFAGAWYIALHAGSVRRYLRLRGNRCPLCNYNLSGLPPSSPCPECGHTAPTQTSIPAALPRRPLLSPKGSNVHSRG
jgi:hypothetical protein